MIDLRAWVLPVDADALNASWRPLSSDALIALREIFPGQLFPFRLNDTPTSVPGKAGRALIVTMPAQCKASPGRRVVSGPKKFGRPGLPKAAPRNETDMLLDLGTRRLVGYKPDRMLDALQASAL